MSVIKVTALFQKIVETKRDNAKLIDRNSNLVKALKNERSSEGPACDNLEAASAGFKSLGAQVRDAAVKNTRMFESAAHAEGDLCWCIILLESLHTAERVRFVRMEEDLVGELAEERVATCRVHPSYQ